MNSGGVCACSDMLRAMEADVARVPPQVFLTHTAVSGLHWHHGPRGNPYLLGGMRPTSPPHSGPHAAPVSAWGP